MASANLEFVRSLYAAWERGDYGSADWAHPDIETVTADGPAPGSWTGIAGMAQAWLDFLNAWEDFRVEAEEYRELDDERVLVLIRKSGRGRASGLALDDMHARAAHLLHVRDGKVTRHVFYLDWERALAELGLVQSQSSNLELVRSIYAANERGDYSTAGWAHPDIEFVVADGPEPGSWTGLAEMSEAWRSFLSAWEEVRTEVDEYRELDDERVLVLAQFSARGRASSLELGQMRAKTAAVHHVSGGKVTRLVLYLDRERALADLGLAPGSEPSG